MKNVSDINKKTLANSFGFFKRITSQSGIIQHTKFGVPDRKNGYSLDDNARALLVAIGWFRLFGDKKAPDLASVYLAWLYHARTEKGFFHNFSNFENSFKEGFSEDGFGRAFWALGYVFYAQPRSDLTQTSKNLIDEIKHNLETLRWPRAMAYSILGLYHLARKEADEPYWKKEMKDLADKLVGLYEKNSEPDWPWFEDQFTYSNHLLPLSLFKAYLTLGEEHYLKIALESLEFLEKSSRLEGIPSPVGSEGWFKKGGKRATYDQQPIEASEACLAFIAAYQATNKASFEQAAYEWFAWYHGNNIKGLSLLDPETGGCFDALNEKGLNQNEGAESIIAYLMAALALVDLERED